MIKKLLFLALLLLLVVPACDNGDEEVLLTPYFPQLANPTAERMTVEPPGNEEEVLPTPYFPQPANPEEEVLPTPYFPQPANPEEEVLPTPYFPQLANPTAERMTEEEVLHTPYFPQLASPMPERMTAEREGELVLVDGCIRLNGAVLIWPYGFRVEVEGEVVRVWDDTDRLVGMVGEPIYVGGGEYALGYGYERHIEKLIGEPLSDNCPGPFWLVGDTYELPQN